MVYEILFYISFTVLVCGTGAYTYVPKVLNYLLHICTEGTEFEHERSAKKHVIFAWRMLITNLSANTDRGPAAPALENSRWTLL